MAEDQVWPERARYVPPQSDPVSLPEAARTAVPPPASPPAPEDYTEEDVATAQAWLEEAEMVNLDEAVPLPILVPFMDYTKEPLLDEERQPVLDEKGQPEQRLRQRRRKAEINTFVPMDVYDRVMALQGKINRLRIELKDDDVEMNRQGLKLMAEAVLMIWRYTEPNMTLDRLLRGLGPLQIRGLFGRFFGPNSPLRSSRAGSGGSTTSASA